MLNRLSRDLAAIGVIHHGKARPFLADARRHGPVSDCRARAAGVDARRASLSIPARALGVALALWTAGPALAAPPAPVSPPYIPPPISVVLRAPAATDDTSAGYKIGDLWLYGGVVYKALQVVAGQAVWQPVPAAQALPTDAAATPLAAYGNRALNAAWLNGNWIDVATSAGGTPTTIKFINGQPDVASLVKLLGSGLGYVSKWYDQSGGVLDAVQATAANQPVIRADITLGGVPTIVYDSVINGGSTTQKYLTLPSGVTASGNADSLFVVGRAYSDRRSVAFAQLTNATYTQTLSSAVVGGAANGLLTTYFYGARYATASPTMTEAVGGWTSSTGGQAVYWGNAVNTYGSQAANTMAGGFIGSVSNSGGSATGYAEISAVVVYARGLSSTDSPNLRASLDRLFNIAPQVQDVYVADGDSITEGFGSTALQNMPRKLLSFLPSSFRTYDTALYGDTTSGRLTSYPTYVAPLYNAKARNNVLTIAVGTNDIGAGGATGAATYANLTQYVNTAHATGWKVVCATVLPRNFTGSAETERQTYNGLIRANGGGTYGSAGQCDGLADIDADTTMGNASAPNNTALYFDGLHPADLGYAYLAPIYAKAIAGVTR